MINETSGLFAKKAADKLRSPDDLDEYVRITQPSVWVVLGACVLLLAGLIAWAVFGTANTNVATTGACVEGRVVCFLPANKVSAIREGDYANVGGELMTVVQISEVPVSRDEARQIVGGDYLANTLVEADWTYVVDFEGGGERALAEGVPIAVNITTERIAPISLMFGGVS